MSFWNKIKNILKPSKVEEKYEIKFPCDGCIIAPTCKKLCDKIIMNDDKLMEEFLLHNCCPDCGSNEFIEGPCGGMAQNVKCAKCGHWFNFALPVAIQRIHIDSEGNLRD